jgi:superfamily II DNA or RNA helicase
MIDPVIISSGITYERKAIQEWLSKHNTCPLTGIVVDRAIMIPNITLRNAIEERKDNRNIIEILDDDVEEYKDLLPYQIPHTEALLDALTRSRVIIDASDTGTGKTYCSMALCKRLGYKAMVFCPKSVLMNWARVAETFGVSLKIANYEFIKNGNMYDVNDGIMTRTTVPYFHPVIVYKKERDRYELSHYVYDGTIPEDTLVIFDEAHRCKNAGTENSKLLSCLNDTSVKILLMSATLTDKVPTFAVFGLMLGLYPTLISYNGWLRSEKIKDTETMKHRTIKGMGDRAHSSEDNSVAILHNKLFPYYGSRMSIKDLGFLFPDNRVTADCYYMKEYNEVEAEYKEINYCLSLLKMKEYNALSVLPRLIRAKQRVELLKVPLYLELIEEALSKHYSVIVFTNYIETMMTLATRLNTDCCVRGGQSIVDREMNIQRFQNNESPIILCSIPSGGVGISLHDIHGGHPRMSIISPTWSGQDLVQAVGRAHRAGAKTPVVQKIVYCAKTYETRICEIIKRKLMNISGINDGDLMGLVFPEHIKNTDEIPSNKYELLTDAEYRDAHGKVIQ